MSTCEHKTSEEYGVCNRCKAMLRIALDAKALLVARKSFLDGLLTEPARMDELQIKVQEAVRKLEQSVQFADDHRLWDPTT